MIHITTCQAENTFEPMRRLADYLAHHLHKQVECVEDVSWPERYRLIDAGEMDIGWICGLPYVDRVHRPDTHIELLAAPVMTGERYGEKPVYFSDVVVHVDSPFQQFADLRGASWAYNEPDSHSGYNVTGYYLARMGETSRFFGKTVGSGAHLKSLHMILDKEIDASAIDSTLLEWAVQERPSLRHHIRIIDIFGPSPIPPLVIQKSVPPQLAGKIRRLLLQMHEEEDGRLLLQSGQLSRFVQVHDQDYNPIRRMKEAAVQIRHK